MGNGQGSESDEYGPCEPLEPLGLVEHRSSHQDHEDGYSRQDSELDGFLFSEPIPGKELE